LSTRDGSRGTVTDPITLPPGDRTGERPHVQWDHVTAPRLSGVPARATTSTVLLVVAIVVLALNLRGPIVAVSAVLEPIRADLGISASTAGLLTSLPVLCFGLATPLASALLGRAGLGRGVSISLIVLLLGIVVRSLDGLPAALAGTVLIGLAVTVANVAVPVVIGQDLPRWSGAVLGVYTAALNVGSMITLTFTVPIADPPAGGSRCSPGARWCWAGSPCGRTRRAARYARTRPVRPTTPPVTTLPPRTTGSGGAARSSGASRRGSPDRPSPTTG
jgi:hypothetical protein